MFPEVLIYACCMSDGVFIEECGCGTARVVRRTYYFIKKTPASKFILKIKTGQGREDAKRDRGAPKGDEEALLRAIETH